MKILNINTPEDNSRFALDAVRAVHSLPFDAALEHGQAAPPHHIPNTKWLLVVELRAIKVLDPAGSGQVIDYCQQKEWAFDTREQLDAAVGIETV